MLFIVYDIYFHLRFVARNHLRANLSQLANVGKIKHCKDQTDFGYNSCLSCGRAKILKNMISYSPQANFYYWCLGKGMMMHS